MSVCYARKQPVIATPCHTLLSNARQMYRKTPLTDQGEWIDWFAYDHDSVKTLLRELVPESEGESPDEAFANCCGPCDSLLYFRQRSLFARILQNPDIDELYVDEQACQILWMAVAASHEAWRERLQQGRRRRSTRHAHRDAVVAAVEFISQNFEQPLTLQVIGKHVSISPAHFCRIFRRYAGTSLHAFIMRMRLAHALNLAPAYRGRTVALAHRLGFASRTHLSSAFRSGFGIPVSSAAQAGESLGAIHVALDDVGQLHADPDAGDMTAFKTVRRSRWEETRRIFPSRTRGRDWKC